MSEKEKSTCERCGLEKELTQYKPNLGKHPGKTVNACDDCAGKDNKLIAIEEPVDVPEISPAVPADKAEGVPVKKFEAVPPEPIKIATPKSAPPAEKTENPDPEPTNPAPLIISRELIGKKLADCEKDADTLKESKQRILAQAEAVKNRLLEVQKMINVTNVRIANYRDILGEKG